MLYLFCYNYYAAVYSVFTPAAVSGRSSLMDEHQLSYEEIDREIAERAKEKRRKRPNTVFDVFEVLAVTLAVLLFINLFLFRQSVVSGQSMMNTLEDGERLIISDLFYSPKSGDIVVVQLPDEITDSFPSLQKKEALVKRVIATEGQTVQIKSGNVYIDGSLLQEEYVYRDGADRFYNMAPVTISPGCVFVMGDHRNNSYDSRYFGEISTDNIVGKVLIRVAPFSRFGGVR